CPHQDASNLVLYLPLVDEFPRSCEGAGVAAAFPVSVDEARVAELRRALGDTAGDPSVAPPTFVVVADQFDPDFDRRPRPGRPWPPPEGVDALLHVEQRIDLGRPVRTGETVAARRLPSRVWHKQGRRGGQLEF